jgi:MFS superfamily sulfate permease-like transporter
MTPAVAPAAATELISGIAGAVASLAIVLTLGLLAYAPTGASAAGLGITAAFAGVVFGGAAMAVFSRARMPTAGPSSATALIFAGFIAELARDPALAAWQGPQRLALVALAGGCVAGAGLLQMLFGALRLGSLARFVPQPVLGGFMNGVAILIVVGQLPTLFGWPPQTGWSTGATLQPLTLAIGLATAALVWLLPRWLPRVPALLVGLLAGTLLQLALHALWPGAALVRPVGALVATLPRPDALLPLWSDAGAIALLQRHGASLAVTALLLALIGSLEAILNALAVDQLMNWRQEPNRELLALGGANIVSGLFGGLPLVYLRARAMATVGAGGRSRAAALAGCATLGVIYAFALPLVSRVPLVVMAGIMLTVAVALMDRWTHQLVLQWWRGERTAEQRNSLLLVATVCLATLCLGFVAAVAVGTLLAALVFMRGLQRLLLRARYSAADRPSRRVYAPPQEAMLVTARARVEVIELEGALFFGSAERLVAEVERVAAERPCVVLDFRRVSSIDASAAVALAGLAERVVQRGGVLLLAGVTAANRHGLALRASGTFREAPRNDWWPDVDRAIEAAEQRLLAAGGLALDGVALPLADCELLQGLGPHQLARVLAALHERQLAAGETLFREGDAGDSVYLLTEGSVSIVGRADADADGPGRQRFVSFSPGVSFGEIAVLDGGGRSADAVADRRSTVHALSRRALGELLAADPAATALLYRNLARSLSQRLRGASSAWLVDAR